MIRTWSCECGATHDRDHNAAINIHKEGLEV
ncbi:zinc ribbon domain-containing protein [Moritella yayanosii]